MVYIFSKKYIYLYICTCWCDHYGYPFHLSLFTSLPPFPLSLLLSPSFSLPLSSSLLSYIWFVLTHSLAVFPVQLPKDSCGLSSSLGELCLSEGLQRTVEQGGGETTRETCQRIQLPPLARCCQGDWGRTFLAGAQWLCGWSSACLCISCYSTQLLQLMATEIDLNMYMQMYSMYMYMYIVCVVQYTCMYTCSCGVQGVAIGW